MNQPGYFEIQAADVPGCVAFYTKVFGWQCQRNPNVPIEYWQVETEGIRGGILQRPVPVPPGPAGTNAYVVSMEVVDFDATAALIEKLGGRVALPKFAVPDTCWQGYFIDLEGNTFGIFEVDTDAK